MPVEVKRATVLTKKILTVEGIPELTAKVNKLLYRLKEDGETAKAAKRVYMSGALMIRDYARSIAPVKSGRFARSLFGSYGRPNAPNVIMGANFKIAPHAWIVEFGSAKTRPHHTIRSAIVAMRGKAGTTIADGLRKVIQDAAGQV